MATWTPEFLAAGQAWELGLSARSRKVRGQWLTPWWLIQASLDQVLPGLGDAPVVLDPACGDGRWLVAVAQRRPDATLIGWDVDPGAIAAAEVVCRAAGVKVRLECRDSLLGEEEGIADLVVGNPPYVRPQHLPKADRQRIWARYTTATDKSDLYAPFIERMLALSRGTLAVVVADTWLSMSSFQALRTLVLAAGIDLLASAPAEAFGAEVGTVLLVVAPSARMRRGRLDGNGLHQTGTLRSVDGLLPLVEAPELSGEGTLGDRWQLRMGVVCGSYPEWVHNGPPQLFDRPTCRGRDVQRWRIEGRGEWLRYEPKAMLARRPYVAPKWEGLFAQPEKVVISGASGRIIRAAVDQQGTFPLDSCYVSQGDGDPWALCGLLNSAPVNAWYGTRFPAPRVKAVELHRLPWPAGPLDDLADAARAHDQLGVDLAAAIAYGLETP